MKEKKGFRSLKPKLWRNKEIISGRRAKFLVLFQKRVITDAAHFITVIITIVGCPTACVFEFT